MLTLRQAISLGIFAVVIVSLLGLSCETKASDEGLRGFFGGGLAGAAIGGIADGGRGAAIGGPVGAIGGMLIGEGIASSRREYRQEPVQYYDNYDDQYADDEGEYVEPVPVQRQVVRQPVRQGRAQVAQQPVQRGRVFYRAR